MKDELVYSEKYFKDNEMFILSSIMHDIKYNSGNLEDWYNDCALIIKDMDKLTDIEFRNLVIVATFVQVAYEMRGTKAPDWCRDKRLTLDSPYVSRGADEIDILMPYQAECNHQVFYDKASYEVL